MKYRVLGPLTVSVDGQDQLNLGGRRQRTVLALLLANPNRVLSQDSIVEQVWAGEPHEKGVHTLHTYISNLRRIVGDAIGREGDGYVLRADDDKRHLRTSNQRSPLSGRGHLLTTVRPDLQIALTDVSGRLKLSRSRVRVPPASRVESRQTASSTGGSGCVLLPTSDGCGTRRVSSKGETSRCIRERHSKA